MRIVPLRPGSQVHRLVIPDPRDRNRIEQEAGHEVLEEGVRFQRLVESSVVTDDGRSVVPRCGRSRSSSCRRRTPGRFREQAPRRGRGAATPRCGAESWNRMCGSFAAVRRPARTRLTLRGWGGNPPPPFNRAPRDAHLAGLEIDVVPRQPRPLAESQSARERHAEERVEPMASGGVQEGPRLVNVEWRDRAPRRLRHLD